MGNCINKNRMYVLRTCNFRRYSDQEYIQGPEIEGVERDNCKLVGRSSERQKQNNIEFQKTDVQKKRLLNQPSPSASTKNQRQSHPLPTPNYSSQSHTVYEVSNANLLPLPKPKTSIKTDEPSSTAAAGACILPTPISDSEILSSPPPKSFPLDQLRRATSDFCEGSLLGEGGSGCVFKGWLDEETLTATWPPSGLPVAIKKLIPSGFQDHKEWLSEVKYLGRLQHRNLVKLIGYCLDGEDRILVYEFMSGGCLENLLFSRSRNCPSLSWARRIKVAVDAARGLCFLHQLESPLIYRDFKTSNVLLDSELNAKLWDYGRAKSGPTTRVMGSEGYCDPHYLATGKLTIQCDVYSFGVVLLELLAGRPVIDTTKFGEEKNLINWARIHVSNENGKVFRIMDTRLEGQYCKRSAYVVANIALRCLNLDPKYRPRMTCILDILENLPSYKIQH